VVLLEMAANLDRRALFSTIPRAQDLEIRRIHLRGFGGLSCGGNCDDFIEQYSYCPAHSTFKISFPVDQKDVLPFFHNHGYAFPTYKFRFSRSLFHRWMDGIVMEQGGTRCVTFPGMCHYNFLNSEITLRFSLHTIDVNGVAMGAPAPQHN